MKYIKLIVVLFLGIGFISNIHAQETWTLRSPLPTAENLNQIIWSGSQLVTIGQHGTIITSPDGTTWTPRNSGTFEDLKGIIWQGGQFMVVGPVGKILTSKDGITWTPRSINPALRLTSITWTGKQFAAIGNNKLIFSPDGITWDDQKFPNSPYMESVAWADTELLGIQHGMLYRLASDSTHWDPIYEPLPSHYSLYQFQSFATSGKLTVAVEGLGNIRTSTDSLHWNPTDIDTTILFRSVAWTGKQFVAVGGNGTIFTSSNGKKWADTLSSSRIRLNEVIWQGDKYIAVGDRGTVKTSTDGITWDDQYLGGLEAELSSISWTGKLFIVLGDRGTLLTSPDGFKWTKRNTGTEANLKKLFWTGTQFVVSCEMVGFILTSPDGITWTQRATGATTIYSVDILKTGTESRIVAYCGNEGCKLSSRDGINWTDESEPYDQYYYSNPYEHWNYFEIMIAIGKNFIRSDVQPKGYTTLSFSDDSLNWTMVRSVYVGGYQLYSWAGKYAVVLENENSETRILTSQDGKDWTTQGIVCGGCVKSIASSGTQLVAVGENGSILTSPFVASTKITHPQQEIKLSKNNFSLRFSKSTLFATLPKSMQGKPANVVVRDISGKKVFESSVTKTQAELVFPISGLNNGRYVLEINAAGQTVAQSFCLLQ